MRRIILIGTLTAFVSLTAIALWYHGYGGIFEPLLKSFAGLQVLADLTIALTLFLIWLWRDAKAAGRNPWPWIGLTLATGSIAPLVYLLLYKSKE